MADRSISPKLALEVLQVLETARNLTSRVELEPLTSSSIALFMFRVVCNEMRVKTFLPIFVALGAISAIALSASSFAQAESSNVERIFASVVGIATKVPADARTAPIIGTTRLGSGIVIDSEGLIVTIGYVLLEAEHVLVFVEKDNPLEANIIGYDVDSGLGLVRAIEPLAVVPMRLGNSSEVAVKDQVLVASFASPRQVTPAFVISRDEFAGYWEYLLERSIVTFPPHESNVAGAAVVNADGRLLGVGALVVQNIPVADQAVPGSMFVPIDELKRVMGALLHEGRNAAPGRPWLGVYVVDQNPGVMIARVATDGPAQLAGLVQGDVIYAVDTTPVENLPQFYRQLWSTGDAGVSVSLSIRRDAQLLHVDVRSADQYGWYKFPGT
jgi:serine protease Do